VAEIRFLLALFATNLKSSFGLRGAFWLQAGFMAANNALFFVFWWIFFTRFEEVSGWRLADVAALYGIVASAYGAAVVFAGGMRELSHRVAAGELDSYLTLPKSPLLQVLGSRTFASGWGDLVSGAGFLALSGLLTWKTWPVALYAIAASTVTFVATAVIAHSLVFWAGRTESVAQQAMDFLVTFSIYPQSLFGGALKIVLFTLIPAAFVGYLPYELVREFRWSWLLAVTAGAALYATIAVAVFAAGLRRYESGNAFRVQA
jgi:ABC-2 type transport system permease protein